MTSTLDREAVFELPTSFDLGILQYFFPVQIKDLKCPVRLKEHEKGCSSIAVVVFVVVVVVVAVVVDFVRGEWGVGGGRVASD